jgi:hypothetical protein
MIRNIACFSSILSALALTGCPSSAEKPTNPAAQQAGEHAHADVGPHGGELIELGGEQYHAELVHPEHGEEHGEDHGDEAVTVYILDETARQPVAIDAAEVKLNMRTRGRGEQFTLTATPDAADAAGTSSRFTSSEPKLLDLFHEQAIEGELVVMIAGMQYRGEIAHHHHEGEDRHDDDGHGHPH